jgi:hypothetical protein
MVQDQIQPAMRSGRFLDWLMAGTAVAIVIGCPVWAVVHFWPF